MGRWQRRIAVFLGQDAGRDYMAAMSSIRPWRDISRRQSRQIMVGNVAVGGDAPVTVQTMTNTPTSDAKATIDQIRRCEEAGADIIRVSCPDVESTAALRPRKTADSRLPTAHVMGLRRVNRRGGLWPSLPN